MFKYNHQVRFNDLINNLSYLLVLNQGGSPYYSQSFHFKSVETCRHFGDRISSTQPKEEDYLMGSYFTALQMYASDVLNSELNLFGLGFSNFRIEGLIRSGIYFIGIFEEEDIQTDSKLHLKLLNSIATEFLRLYPFASQMKNSVFNNQFYDFTEHLMKLFGEEATDMNCRDCIVRCSDSHKGCVPHHFYFKRLRMDKASEIVSLDINEDTSNMDA